MPLWTTTRAPRRSAWGWAFSSEGRPWVAQRVWPIPSEPVTGGWRHVLRDGRGGADVGALADREEGHEARVGADERAVADRGRVLRDAVVVARDRAGADVDVGAHGRVADVGDVRHLRPATDAR